MSDFAIIKNRKNIKIKEYGIIKLLYNVSFYIITAVLLFSGVAKIIAPLPLINTLKLITIIPESLQLIIATLLPIVEIGLATLMLFNIKPPVMAKINKAGPVTAKLNEAGRLTLTVVTILFALFLAFSIYGIVVGFGGDCGCFGNTIKSSFGWGMIGRNIIFLILSLILTINAWRRAELKTNK